VSRVVADHLGYTDESYRKIGASSYATLYTDPAVLASERTHLFSKTWALVASTNELAAPGSYMTSSVGGIPLAVVRDQDGTLRAFHNVCRHRGIALLEGSGILGRFMTCPYHQWSYALNGDLARVPQEEAQFDGLDHCTMGLHRAQVAEWQGMVFANPSLDAPSLDASMSGLDQRLDHFLSGPLQQVAKVEYEAACNWKLLVENHIDVYHLWYLHARSLAAYEHRAFQWESLGDNWWSLEPLKDPASGSDGFEWVDDEMRHRIGAYLLFPNLMLVTTDHYFATYDATPLGPDRTHLTLRVRATDDADPDALVQSIRSFMAEDVHACERMQAGAASPHFTVGATARTHEQPIHRFHHSLRQWISA
jgi:Rieske 2Fe-2S family protein